MRYALLLLAVLPLRGTASEYLPLGDSVMFDATGGRIVLRRIDWPDVDGGLTRIELKLTLNKDGHLRYDFDAQSPATQDFHRRLCKNKGLDPATGGETILIGTTAAWHCNSTGPLPDSAGEPSPAPPPGTADRAIDYVYANAPNGTAQVGVSFYARGNVRYESSQAGSIQASLQLHDNRCSTYFSQYYPYPFSGNHNAEVACLVQEPGLVITRMEGCIPKLCGYDSGTVAVR